MSSVPYGGIFEEHLASIKNFKASKPNEWLLVSKQIARAVV